MFQFQAYRRRLKAYRVYVVRSGMEYAAWIALDACEIPAHVATSNLSFPSSTGSQNTGTTSCSSALCYHSARLSFIWMSFPSINNFLGDGSAKFILQLYPIYCRSPYEGDFLSFSFICRLEHLQGDAIAGLTVGLTVIPQGLAYAQVAELPPQVHGQTIEQFNACHSIVLRVCIWVGTRKIYDVVCPL